MKDLIQVHFLWFPYVRIRRSWSWVPCVACLVGGVLGAFLYIGFIEMHHDPDETENEAELAQLQDDSLRENQDWIGKESTI